MPPYPANSVFCKDKVSLCCQVGPDFLGSSAPFSASHSAGITGMSHYAQPVFCSLNKGRTVW
uniref:PRO2792 n=1 Tax=Homo sapiens TaxID=9606 RepID=Q9P149_HUMAN|nr:PRO2792 [Homo sapiens]